MKKKIVIITRDSEQAYNEDYPLSNLMRGSDKQQILQSNLAAFEFAIDKYFKLGENDHSFGKWLKEVSCYSNATLKFIANNYSKKNKNSEGNNDEWCIIPDKLIQLPINEDQVSIYDKIVKGDDEIYILYWNRTKGFVKTPGVLLSLICKDCDIDENSESDNYLYIHDDEWGIRGNQLLIIPTQNANGDQQIITQSKTHEVVLDELIKRKFSFAAAFQHHNDEGTLFRDILECKFGEEPIYTALGKIEKEHKNCKKMLPVIVKKYKKVQK